MLLNIQRPPALTGRYGIDIAALHEWCNCMYTALLRFSTNIDAVNITGLPDKFLPKATDGEVTDEQGSLETV